MFKLDIPTTVCPDFDINLIESKDRKHSCERDSFGNPKHAQVVDQFDSQPFLQGENGFRRNDIAILQGAESEELKEAIASRLVEMRDNASFSDMSDSEIAKLAIPRYCQTPASLSDWQASIDHGNLAKEVDSFISAKESEAQKQADIESKLAELETLKAKKDSVEPKTE